MSVPDTGLQELLSRAERRYDEDAIHGAPLYAPARSSLEESNMTLIPTSRRPAAVSERTYTYPPAYSC